MKVFSNYSMVSTIFLCHFGSGCAERFIVSNGCVTLSAEQSIVGTPILAL